MRQHRATLDQIASHFGISLSGVSNLLVKHYGTTQIDGLLTVAELARLTGLTTAYIIKLKRRGVIQPVQIGRKNRLWAPETIAAIIIYNDGHPQRCRVCHAPLPPGYWVYCSRACRMKQYSYKNKSDEAKRRHKARVKRWRQAHPRQARQISQRAMQKFLDKKKEPDK